MNKKYEIMTHTYQVTGMTCGSCEVKVKSALLSVNNVTSVEVSKDNNAAIITMDKHIALPELQSALEEKHQISATNQNKTV
jgi:copper chaperone CopZ